METGVTLFLEDKFQRGGKLINDIAEVGGTEERMTQPRNKEGDMRTGVRRKEGRHLREEGERAEAGIQLSPTVQ